MTGLNDTIDARLAELRPDRYQPGDADWLDPIVHEIAGQIPADDARLRVARDVVTRREAEAMKRTNRVLRHIVQTGQFPIDWLDMQRWPLGCGEWRVTLGACMALDLREFAHVERRRAAADFAARNESCQGAERLAQMIDDGDVLFVADLTAPAPTAV